MKIRHRARIRSKDLARFAESMRDQLGASPISESDDVDRAEATDAWDVLLFGGRAVAVVLKGEAERVFPTLRGLLVAKPARRYVTVDMGAVKFMANGADVMAPGIVEADPGIVPGDLVWVRDEKNKQPLAVGEALVEGKAMPRGPKGKAVKTFHYVGDELWTLEI